MTASRDLPVNSTTESIHDVLGSDPISHLFSVMDMGDQRELASTSSIFNRIFEKSIREQLINQLSNLLVERKNRFLKDHELKNLKFDLHKFSSRQLHTLIYHLKYTYRTQDEKYKFIAWLRDCINVDIEDKHTLTFLKIAYDLLQSDSEYTTPIDDSFVFDEKMIKEIKAAIKFIFENIDCFYSYATLATGGNPDCYEELKEMAIRKFTRDPVKSFIFHLLKNKFICHPHVDHSQHIDKIQEKISAYSESSKKPNLNSSFINGSDIAQNMYVSEAATDFLLNLAENLDISIAGIREHDPCITIIVVTHKKTIENYCDQNADPDKKEILVNELVSLISSKRYAYSLKEQIEKLDLLFNEILGGKASSLKSMLLIYLIRFNRSVDLDYYGISSHLESFKRLLSSEHPDRCKLATDILQVFNETLFDNVSDVKYDLADNLLKFNYEKIDFWSLIARHMGSISLYRELFDSGLGELSFAMPKRVIQSFEQSEYIQSIIICLINWLVYVDSEKQSVVLDGMLTFAKSFLRFSKQHTMEYDDELFKQKKFWDIFCNDVNFVMQPFTDQINTNLLRVLSKDPVQMLSKISALRKFTRQLTAEKVNAPLFGSILDKQCSVLDFLLELPCPIVEYVSRHLKAPQNSNQWTANFYQIVFKHNEIINAYYGLFLHYYLSLNKPEFQSFIQALSKQPFDVLVNLVQTGKLHQIFQKLQRMDVGDKALLAEFIAEEININVFYRALCPFMQCKAPFFSTSANMPNGSNKRPHDNAPNQDEPASKRARTINSPENNPLSLLGQNSIFLGNEPNPAFSIIAPVTDLDIDAMDIDAPSNK